MKHGVYQESNKFKAYVNGEIIYSARLQKNTEYFFAQAVKNTKIETPAEDHVFHINQRFDFLKKTVKMVASGVQASAVITGAGGLGKSYSVKKALKESGLRELSSMVAEEDQVVNRNRSFVFVKGYSTAKGLYRTLFENNDSVLVLDDCDSVLKDPVALNILKSALDSYDTRVISWNADMRDDDLPRSFLYTGRVVFISNLDSSKIDQAIRSRSAMIDVSMSRSEIVDRMATMIRDEEFLPQFTENIKEEALEFISENKDKMKEISLRTIITVSKVRAADTDGSWKDLAKYLTVV